MKAKKWIWQSDIEKVKDEKKLKEEWNIEIWGMCMANLKSDIVWFVWVTFPC